MTEEISRRQFITGSLAAFTAFAFPHEAYAEEKKKKKKTSKRMPKKEKSYKTNDFSHDSDDVLLARMLFGEARSCSDLERTAIGYTAVNRKDDAKHRYGRSLHDVILKPKQYSCFNTDDPNLPKLKDPEKYDKPAFHECLKVAKNVVSGKNTDPANATHYFNPEVINPPFWTKDKNMEKIGKLKISEKELSKHEFYREK